MTKKEIIVTSSVVVDEYEGGYTGDEIITRRLTYYHVFVNGKEVYKSHWPGEVIKYVNEKYAAKKQASLERKLYKAAKKLNMARDEFNELQKQVNQLRVGEWRA